MVLIDVAWAEETHFFCRTFIQKRLISFFIVYIYLNLNHRWLWQDPSPWSCQCRVLRSSQPKQHQSRPFHLIKYMYIYLNLNNRWLWQDPTPWSCQCRVLRSSHWRVDVCFRDGEGEVWSGAHCYGEMYLCLWGQIQTHRSIFWSCRKVRRGLVSHSLLWSDVSMPLEADKDTQINTLIL